ncbi:MAG: T9SS type A sorting domain-containing protein [Bacteroidia bacterium]|jgi:hypothetical protein|nr:T9SS type A sorting domain-containing protein [Bacteroidia bacterium]
MKKQVLSIVAMAVLTLLSVTSFAQTRYINDVFANVLKTSNVLYDTNRSVNIFFPAVPGQLPIITAPLRCDIYRPDGDTLTARPTVIIAHTGSYLPTLVNRQATGSKDDSAVVELCTRLAKRGFTAVAINYRLGWNAASTEQAVATEQLLKATYRGIQDVRNAIRFLRANASTYGVDTSKFIVGGQGTGGYIALGLGTIDRKQEIENNAKFQRGDFTPMVNVDTLGDWFGSAGATLPVYPFTFNYGGDPTVSANAHMVFNFGGAMGDLAWLEATNSLPVVGMHVVTDPFAPYTTGNVTVPVTGVTVIPSASGAGAVIPKANELGVNSKLNSKFLVDPYSLTALVRADGENNLYPFISPTPNDGAPWEWWDRATIQAATSGSFYGSPVPANGFRADSTSFATNPTMSAAKARAYIDTIVNFVTARIAVQFDLVPPSADAAKEFALVSPPNNTVAKIEGDGEQEVIVAWENANTNGFGNISYQWVASPVEAIDFANPDLAITVPVNGFPLTFETIRDILADAGLIVGDTIQMAWSVKSTLNGVDAWAADTFNITLIRGILTNVNDAQLFANDVKLYPNPATTELTVSLPTAIQSVSVLDITGREVMTELGNGNAVKLNTSTLRPGLYLVNVTSTDGRSAAKRLVIQ